MKESNCGNTRPRPGAAGANKAGHKGPGHVTRSARRAGKRATSACLLAEPERGSEGLPGCRANHAAVKRVASHKAAASIPPSKHFPFRCSERARQRRGQRERTGSPEGLLSGAGLGGARPSPAGRPPRASVLAGAEPDRQGGLVRSGMAAGVVGCAARRRRPDPCPSQERGGKRRWWSRW